MQGSGNERGEDVLGRQEVAGLPGLLADVARGRGAQPGGTGEGGGGVEGGGRRGCGEAPARGRGGGDEEDLCRATQTEWTPRARRQ